MAVFVGASGLVTSWSSNTQLIETGHRPATFDLRVQADTPDVTGFASGLKAFSHIPGLRSVTGTIRGLSIANSGPLIGNLGSVTYSGGYVTNVRGWTLNVECSALESTAFGASDTTNGWKQFVPGMLRWGGTYSAQQDDTTPLVAPGKSGDPAAATFVVYTSKSFGGSIVSESLDASVATDAIATAEYAYRGSGDLTVTDASGTLPFAAGVIPRPTAGTLTLTAITNQTFAISAFWTAVRMVVVQDQAVTVEVDFQGSGALTIG